MAQGRKEEAEEILRKLMQQRGFYPMVAAQRLGVEYPLQVDQAPAADNSVVQGPEMARARADVLGLDNRRAASGPT